MHKLGKEPGESNLIVKKKWAMVHMLQLTENQTTKKMKNGAMNPWFCWISDF